MSPTTNAVEVERLGNLRIFSDGYVVRSPKIFSTPILDDGSVIWKDAQFDSTHNLYLRIFRPTNPITSTSKLPILFYFYGGAFVDGSRSWNHFHNYCHRLASELNALVISPDYRFAPENRLPAPIQDAASAVEWLRSHGASEEWLADAADFQNVFILGDSCGGTIAHHLAVRFSECTAALVPVCIRGYVLLEPFFGGVERTKSELECPLDVTVNLELCDRLWELSLPVGADRDHPLANPFGPESASLEDVELEATLVVVCGCDVLRDRGVEYGQRLRELGKPVVVAEFEGQQHGFFLHHPLSEPAAQLMAVLKRFVFDHGVKD